jgi:hypothetical protein
VFVACVIVTIVIALLSAVSAVAKLREEPAIIEGLVDKLGLSRSWLRPLASLELAGAAGALIGLAWAPIGIAATTGLTLYFLGAVGIHVQKGDTAGVIRPLPFLVLAALALALRAATA